MLEPTEIIPERSVDSHEAPIARDEHSMLLLEYLVSIVAIAAAVLLAIAR